MMLDVEGGISVIRGMRSDYWEETPLTAEQLAAYAALHSLYPATTVTNDEGAGIGIEYVADTKNYIDNKTTKNTEVWTFTLTDGSTVKKEVVVG